MSNWKTTLAATVAEETRWMDQMEELWSRVILQGVDLFVNELQQLGVGAEVKPKDQGSPYDCVIKLPPHRGRASSQGHLELTIHAHVPNLVYIRSIGGNGRRVAMPGTPEEVAALLTEMYSEPFV